MDAVSACLSDVFRACISLPTLLLAYFYSLSNLLAFDPTSQSLSHLSALPCPHRQRERTVLLLAAEHLGSEKMVEVCKWLAGHGADTNMADEVTNIISIKR